MIDFTRAFDSAWERMLVILFRPFDLKKWFIIGFNVFLAFLAEGGVAVNNPISFNQRQTYNFPSLPAMLHTFNQSIGWLRVQAMSPWLALYVGLGVLYLIVWLTLNWVGCRGQFLFLDNIVRNRPAISWPWRRYAHQGNVFFLFHLGWSFLSFVFFLGMGALFLLLNWSWITGERNPNGSEITLLVCLLLIFMGFLIVYAVITFLIYHWGIPLYFKQSKGLVEALLALGHLAVGRPISVVVYLLISFALAIAVGLVAILVLCVACCLTCWLACIPFVGSMLLSFVLYQLLLPVLIFIRCFQLDCLAQFGPQYDVWTVDVPPPSSTPQPLPG